LGYEENDPLGNRSENFTAESAGDGAGKRRYVSKISVSNFLELVDRTKADQLLETTTLDRQGRGNAYRVVKTVKRYSREILFSF
jgi:hypothetical protein